MPGHRTLAASPPAVAAASTDGTLLDPLASKVTLANAGPKASPAGVSFLIVLFEFIVVSGVVVIAIDARSRSTSL